MVAEVLAVWALIGLSMLVALLVQLDIKKGHVERDWISVLVFFIVIVCWPYCLWLLIKKRGELP